ncbi:MAG: HAD-IA family hydrolase [Spirochaetales bacterium]|nr:HAD-IA family hydrolase [Spirochaetales bacterium]
MKYKLVLFDLDDTIYDHQYSRRCGLHELTEFYDLAGTRLEDLERVHQYYLDLNYGRVLDGAMSIDESRKQRMGTFLSHFGCSVDTAEAARATKIYKTAYLNNTRSIPGVNDFIRAMRKHARTGIITNGLTDTQNEKIRVCNVGNDMDYIFISEQVGFRKPEREFFACVLGTTGCRAGECLVIGDSWPSDIEGAHNMGIDCIWMNRYGLPCPDPSFIVAEIDSWENQDKLFEILD